MNTTTNTLQLETTNIITSERTEYDGFRVGQWIRKVGDNFWHTYEIQKVVVRRSEPTRMVRHCDTTYEDAYLVTRTPGGRVRIISIDRARDASDPWDARDSRYRSMVARNWWATKKAAARAAAEVADEKKRTAEIKAGVPALFAKMVNAGSMHPATAEMRVRAAGGDVETFLGLIG